MNLGAIGRTVKDLADAMINRLPRQAAKAFIEGVRVDVRVAFDKGIDPVTQTPWAPTKSRVGKILVKSGTLRDATFQAVDRAQPSGFGVTIQMTSPAYGKYHQRGGKRLPRRRFLGISPATSAKVSKAYSGEVVKLMVK